MKILHLNDYISTHGGSGVVAKNIIRTSKHEGVFTTYELAEDLDSYDIIHVHNVWSKNFNKIRNRNNIVMSIHDFRLTKCLRAMRLCEAEPNRKCLPCRGILGFYTFNLRLRPLWNYVKTEKPKLVVHSRYMKKYYEPEHKTTYLPIPLETKDMEPSRNQEDYLFYSARCSNEKNPFGFAKLCRDLNKKGIMALVISNTYFKKYMKEFQKYKNVEVVVEPEFKELVELYRHAKLTVHPYLYPEPFGIANVNSILCGTPVLSFPFGNLPFVSTSTAYSYNALRNMVERAVENPAYYGVLRQKTLRLRNRFVSEFDCGPKYDRFYEDFLNLQTVKKYKRKRKCGKRKTVRVRSYVRKHE